jgi:UDPglucose 6-dehydrogenase
MTRIAIIGSGVVGTATGKGFHRLGHDVTFYDISKRKLFSLREEGFNIGSTVKDVIHKSDLSFVCVNTPTISNNNSEGQQDLSQLLSVLFDITNAFNSGAAIKDASHHRPHLLVFRSTMLPGTMRNLVVDYMKRNCSLKLGKDYGICYNPEFLRQHCALEDFFHPDRVVIGVGEGREEEEGQGSSITATTTTTTTTTTSSYMPLKHIYQQLTNDIIITSYEAAELIKYASNCFLSLKISFFNEIGIICKKLGIDDKTVNLAVSLDKRIGKYGTEAGRPFGGACLPKDTEAMASFVKKLQIKPDLIQVAADINKKIGELTSTKQVMREITD